MARLLAWLSLIAAASATYSEWQGGSQGKAAGGYGGGSEAVSVTIITTYKGGNEKMQYWNNPPMKEGAMHSVCSLLLKVHNWLFSNELHDRLRLAAPMDSFSPQKLSRQTRVIWSSSHLCHRTTPPLNPLSNNRA